MKNSGFWTLFITLTTVLSAVAFTPLVIPAGVSEPYVLGLPRTLWSGMALSISIYFVLVAAALKSGGE